MGCKVTVLSVSSPGDAGGGVCPEKLRTECSGRLRVSRLGSLQLSVSLFPGEDLVISSIQITILLRGSSGRGQFRDHRGASAHTGNS